MAKVKRPSLKRYPKRPKANASLDSWKRFDENCKKTEKDNAGRMSDYTKKVASINSAKKTKVKIQNSTKGLKGIALPGNRKKR